MRVAYVVKRYPRYSETFIVNEILAHEEAGTEIEIFALGPSEDTHFQDIISKVRAPLRYLSADRMRTSDFWQLLSQTSDKLPRFAQALKLGLATEAQYVAQAALLASALVDRGIDHIHAHFATSATIVARLASHFSGIPFSFTAHAKDIYHEGADIEAVTRMLDDAALTITVSDFNADYLHSKYGTSASRVRRLYNGIDTQRFSFSTQNREHALLLAVGRLVQKKGFEDLIRACALLDRGSFTCRIVGSGPLGPRLQALVDEHGLGDRVFLDGPLPQEQVHRLMQRATVFVAPCVVGSDGDRDGMPTVLLEAMATGVPCVSTRVTAIPELISHGKTGLLADERDAPSLAREMSRILDAPAFGAALALAARGEIETRFNVRRNAADMRKMFFECRK